jgi:hypothetical protein
MLSAGRVYEILSGFPGVSEDRRDACYLIVSVFDIKHSDQGSNAVVTCVDASVYG